MSDKKVDVPYIVHEGAMARLDRTIKRLWIVIILLILLLVASNAGWLYYESQFETVPEQKTVTTTQKVTQDNDGGDNSFVGGDVNGETDSSNKEDSSDNR